MQLGGYPIFTGCIAIDTKRRGKDECMPASIPYRPSYRYRVKQVVQDMGDPRIRLTIVVAAIFSAVAATAATVGTYYVAQNSTNSSISELKTSMIERIGQSEQRLDNRLSTIDMDARDRTSKLEGRQQADETKIAATDARLDDIKAMLIGFMSEMRNKLDNIDSKVEHATAILEGTQPKQRGR